MGEKMKYVVCYSGGHSSALAAIETVRRYGKVDTILLNHDISNKVEDKDVKRFKQEVADYLGLSITYANREHFQNDTPLSLCRQMNTFRFSAGNSICTYYLKTEPFYKWLKACFPIKSKEISQDITLVYGFDKKEINRIMRRRQHLLRMGYLSEYPLAEGNSSYLLQDIRDIGINLPQTYSYTKHANCKGCLKAGKQHWYMVYCRWPKIFKEAIETEIMIGHSIIKENYLCELVPLYEKMKAADIEPNDKEHCSIFWSRVKKILGEFHFYKKN